MSSIWFEITLKVEVRACLICSSRSFDLFSALLDKLKIDYITVLMNLKVIEQKKEDFETKIESKNLNDPKCLLVLKKDQKISRNERCEATGKKFKNCCGAL